MVGYGASSLGIKLDVENAGARFLLTLFFYIVHVIVYFGVARYLVSLPSNGAGSMNLDRRFGNAFLGVVLYTLLDRLKQRT